jgi:translation initiation factor 2-alpha kinase 4
MGNPPAKENRPGRSPTVSQPADIYAKAQDDEREVLKAIYMEDFEEVEATGAWSVRFYFSFPVLRRLRCCPVIL